MVFAHIKCYPHLVHQSHRHDGCTRAHKFANTRINAGHFAIKLCHEHHFFLVALHLTDGTTSAMHQGSCRLFVFDLRTILRHVILRFSSTFRGNRRITLSCHLVELLSRGNTFVKKAFHTRITLFHHLTTGNGFLPKFIGTAYLFFARTLVCLATLGSRCILCRLGLHQLGVYFGSFQESEGVAGVDELTFFNENVCHTGRYFARYAIFGDIGLTLNDVLFGTKGEISAYGGESYDSHDENDGWNIIGSLLFHFNLLFSG